MTHRPPRLPSLGRRADTLRHGDTSDAGGTVRNTTKHHGGLRTTKRLGAPQVAMKHHGGLRTTKRLGAPQVAMKHHGGLRTTKRLGAPQVATKHHGGLRTTKRLGAPQVAMKHHEALVKVWILVGGNTIIVRHVHNFTSILYLQLQVN